MKANVAAIGADPLDILDAGAREIILHAVKARARSKINRRVAI